jgi:regulator of protease activity HflC (stomatin/prohibitin superfamily)
MNALRHLGSFFRRCGLLLRAAPWAVALGIVETLDSSRGRRVLALCALGGVAAAIAIARPVRSVAPGEVAIRTNRINGRMTELGEGLRLMLPGLHELRRYSLRDQIYRPKQAAKSDGEAPFQSAEGLSIGVDVAVRYALDPASIVAVARRLPADIGRELVEPVADGVLHRTFARHTVREIFSSQRGEIQQALGEELRAALAPDGVVVKAVFLGNVDLPTQYRSGLEALLAEELAAEKMRYTIELTEKKVKESAFAAEADKVRREKAAEAAGLEEVIAARSREEAMKHVLPFKEKEIEQRRLEAEAAKQARVKQAEAEAEARRIESGGEADSRRRLAEADAYRMEVTGKATSEQLQRESELIARNPLLIQKTLADKLSDKIQVIVAPPAAGGFFAGGLLAAGHAQPASPERPATQAAAVINEEE